jgi:hypothetical protein
MNREQYLLKRAWLRGVPAGRGVAMEMRCPGAVSTLPSELPPSAFSLTDHYRRLHFSEGCFDREGALAPARFP